MSDRKRAIETLKQLRLDYEEFYEEHNNEVTQAYDMAISSLETDEAYQLEYEPTTKNDLAVDAISRPDFIDWLKNWTLGDASPLIDFVNSMPSVTPQKIGHWIEHDWKEFLGEGYYRCSVCNHGYQRYTKGIRKSDVPYIDGKEYTLWNIDHYCPNCGARMIEPQESEEQTDES